MKLVHAFTATTLMFVSALSFASGLTFADLDSNDDALISEEEASVNMQLSAQFSALDLDKDKRLTSREFSNFKL
ncbi:EF-hand domain-containing protein [Pseudoalteromonas aurantia]|uniref:Calmodulin n=1 Tax=Pseudoalteromonas aurantia 208 TaxID=1314867 RepID=A0ABR9EID9_9GAMM|nr:EF-hand domain-containing protein [Pseudoalteromonas aurantia]MBE0370752.1 hypothetical protein [Pseudoalteromonas aurantia 208]